MKDQLKHEFLEAVHSRRPVIGLTHGFYRYPARFSPLFARAAINAFSEPGDVILDPFMGGGTTLVEAQALGRFAIGTDINELAVFVSKAKTTVLSTEALGGLVAWFDQTIKSVSLRQTAVRSEILANQYYSRNINDRTTWHIRKYLQLSLERLDQLSTAQQTLARCILLRASQWALDCRKEIPTIHEFRSQLVKHRDEMVAGARQYAEAVREVDQLRDLPSSHKPVCILRSAVGLETESIFRNIRPRLILTSPPYPGVHVLYHRWQVQSRRETPAPYWLTNTLDGKGASYYNFGDRKQGELVDYYDQALSAFTSITRISDERTIVVQLIAFSDPSWQLPRYIQTMKKAGLREVQRPSLANSADGRLWRVVPNRKWYAARSHTNATSKEVVLFHRLA